MTKELMLTTIDNPFDPFDNFIEWFLYDVEKGYNTCDYLGRVVQLKPDMTSKEELEEVNRAINKILDNDFLGIYLKLERDSESETSSKSVAKAIETAKESAT